MKKILNIAIGLISSIGFSQQVITEEKIEKDCKAIDFVFSLNSNIISVAKYKPVGGLVAADYIYYLSNYDKDGNKMLVSDNNKLYTYYMSYTDNSIYTFDITKGILSSKPIVISNKKTFHIDKSIIKKSFPINHTKLTSKNLVSLTDKKGYGIFDLRKDDIYFNVLNYETNNFNTNIIKFDLTKLIGPNFIKPEENVGCSLNVNYEGSFDLITKSITNDYKSVKLYKRRISEKGETLKEIELKLDLPDNNVFIYSDSHAGNYTFRTNSGFPYFADDLAINNYIEDSSNGDIFVYGLFADKPEKLNVFNNIKGYYIFKFDANGNKIWESINPIIDSDLNKKDGLSSVFVNLKVINDKLFFNIKIFGLKDFFNGTFLSKESGKILNTKNFEFSETFSQVFDEYQLFKINKDYKTDINLKRKKFSFETIALLNFDNRILNYIKSVDSKREVKFYTFISKDGIWLTETVDKEYYKIIYFENK
jgi:hypothetical protein